MGRVPVPCRIYIVYRNTLFAAGIRSLLRGQRALKVVGTESDPTKALDAVATLRPEVIIIEESDAETQSATLEDILQRHPEGRVVAMDLNHNFATVYDRRRVVTTQPTDLIRAIRGFPRDRGDPTPAGPGRGSSTGRAQRGGAVGAPGRKGRER